MVRAESRTCTFGSFVGIKNIHLGPTLPAFLSPEVVDVLVDKFDIAGITTVENDMEIFFG